MAERWFWVNGAPKTVSDLMFSLKAQGEHLSPAVVMAAHP
jgi:hypothetical protein